MISNCSWSWTTAMKIASSGLVSFRPASFRSRAVDFYHLIFERKNNHSILPTLRLMHLLRTWRLYLVYIFSFLGVASQNNSFYSKNIFKLQNANRDRKLVWFNWNHIISNPNPPKDAARRPRKSTWQTRFL